MGNLVVPTGVTYDLWERDEVKLTPAQKRLLLALVNTTIDRPMTGSNVAWAAGYQGKGRSGAGRAPQWTGRVMLNMPADLVRNKGRDYWLTDKGREIAKGLKP